MVRFKKLIKQRKTGIAWGYFMQIIQQEAVVVQGIVVVLSLITTASVLQIRGYDIPIWLLALIAGIVLILGGVVVFVKGMPSYFKAFNEQWCKHDNPMMKKIDKIEKNQELIMKHLGLQDKEEKDNGDKTL